MQNAKEIFEGCWADRPYEVVKKGQKRGYKINTSPARWPTRFARPPSIQVRHSTRVLFVVEQANKREREQILEAIFDLSREEIVKRVQAGTLSQMALNAHDYAYDIFPGFEGEQHQAAKSR